MPNGVKEIQKAFSEGTKSNGDLVLLENQQIVDHKIERSKAKNSHLQLNEIVSIHPLWLTL